MPRDYHKYEHGDSLIEVLVVSFILMTTLVALTSLTTISVARNRLSKERVVATRLAQEGLEWLKSERDRMGYDSFATTISAVHQENFCIPVASGSLMNPSKSDDPTHDNTCIVTSAQSTQYYRWVSVDMDDLNNRITLEVSVWWPGQQKEITIQGLLTKWQK